MIDKQKIINELIAERENKRNKVKALDNMLGRELKSEEDAYENIVEMQRFLFAPLDNILNVADKINQKYA